MEINIINNDNNLGNKKVIKFNKNNTDIFEPISNLKNNFSEIELINLKKFQEYCIDNNINFENNNNLIITNDLIIRFLSSNKNNIKLTIQKLNQYIKFYKDFRVNEIPKELFNIDKIKIFYPHNIHKITLEGNPILIQNLGEIHIDDLNKILPELILKKYIIYFLEKIKNEIFPKTSKFYNKNINKIFCIVDLLGLTGTLLSKKVLNFLKIQLNIVENYYPCILDKLYFVNTSFIFRATWNTCKYFYSKDIREKINLLGFDYFQQLNAKVAPVNLPKFFGGLCNCEPYGCIFSDEGPWNEKSLLNNLSNYKINENNLKKFNDNNTVNSNVKLRKINDNILILNKKLELKKNDN